MGFGPMQIFDGVDSRFESIPKWNVERSLTKHEVVSLLLTTQLSASCEQEQLKVEQLDFLYVFFYAWKVLFTLNR